MSNEHNPIALRISRLQRKWKEEVKKNPEKPIFRWVIDGESARLFDGFCKLESSPHGSLSEVMVVLMTPFLKSDDFSQKLISDWVETYENEKEEIPGFIWDLTPFKEKLFSGDQPNTVFLEMLCSFKKAMGNRNLIVGLIPVTMSNSQEMESWLKELLLLEFPKGLRLMLLDYKEEQYFENLFKENKEKVHSIEIDLDYSGAIDKLARSGNPHAPDVKFRVCMLEMSKAVNSGNESKLNNLGKKLLEIGQKSGDRGMFVTAHVVYAGMLFHFGRDEQIGDLLDKGLRLSKRGIDGGDESLIPITIQCHGYIAANHQINNRYQDAITWFLKQGDLCKVRGLVLQSIPAYHQALEIAKRKRRDQVKEIVVRAFLTGQSLTEKELQFSDYIYIALEHKDLAKKDPELQADAVKADVKLKKVFGENWAETARNRKSSYQNSIPNPQPI